MLTHKVKTKFSREFSANPYPSNKKECRYPRFTPIVFTHQYVITTGRGKVED